MWQKEPFMWYQGAVNGENDISSSSAKTGRSAERWRRLALLRSGDVGPNPGPPRARSRGGELLTAEITAGNATKDRRALDDFEMFLAVRDCGSCRSLLAQGLLFVVEAAAKYLGWGFGSGELSSGAAGTLVAALRRLVQFAVSLGASVADSTLHFRALWRLHKSWLLAVPTEFRTPVDFELALASAVLATVSGEIELGLSFVGMFHFLLRPGEWREVTWKGIHIFENSQTTRYANVFGILGVRAPKTRRQQVHVKVQHVLVECPGLTCNSVLMSRAPSLLALARARNMPQNFKLSFVVLAS